MQRPGKGCDPSKMTQDLFDLGDKFIKNVGDGIHDPSMILERTFKDVFNGMPLNRIGAFKMTKGELNTFKNKLSKIEKAVKQEKIAGQLGKLFYTPSVLGKKAPHVGELLDNYINVGHYFRGHQASSSNSFKMITEALQTEAKARGMNGTFAKRNWNKALKKADEFDRKIEQLHVDAFNNKSGAQEELDVMIAAETRFYTQEEGKLFNEFREIIEDKLPKLQTKLNKKYSASIKAAKTPFQKMKIRKEKAKDHLSDIIETAPMRKAVENYMEMMHSSYDLLSNGIKASVDTIKESLYDVKNIDEVENIGKKIMEKVMPTESIGYYPHYRRATRDFLDNLMPHMQRVTDATVESIRNNDKPIQEAIDGLKGYVNKRAKSRELDVNPEQYSRNILPNIKRYTDEVAKYNYIANINLRTKQILNDAKKSFKNGEDLTGYGVAVKDMILDLHNSATGGERFQNDNVESAMRSVLGMEFVSKLGLNVRGSIRNSTQALLNIVEMGPVMWAKSKAWYSRLPAEEVARIDQLARDAGLLFEEAAPELAETIGADPIISTKLKLTDKETVELNKPSKFQRFEKNMVRNLAHKAGGLMRKVENFNRISTFKLAYYKMHNELSNSTLYAKSLKDKGMSDTQVDKDVERRAYNFAIRTTSGLHFDYSSYSKAKALRHPVGRVLGQFQHYGFKFLEYNTNLAREAKDDILAGHIGGDRAWKAYRMGMTYFLAPTLASAVTGVNWANLVEHNTKEKISQLFALFTGDDEEIQKAFYGRGPLTGLIGAPLISDMLALGHIHEWWEMDEDGMAALLTGYRDYANVSGYRKAYETLRLLNTQIGRTAYQTFPLITSSSIGAAAQFELGLYPTKGVKELQEKVIGMQKELPTEMQLALNELMNKAKAHKKRAIANPF